MNAEVPTSLGAQITFRLGHSSNDGIQTVERFKHLRSLFFSAKEWFTLKQAGLIRFE